QLPKKRKRTAKKEQKEKRKKDKIVLNNQRSLQEVQSEPFLRQMIPVLSSTAEETSQNRIKIMTYNLLAQSLIRREIFPESGDALKWKNRRPRLLKEILYYDPDVSCFQEMDRSNYLDTFKPEFELAGYETCFAGVKKHDPTYKLMVRNTSLTADEISALETSMRPFGENATSNDSPSTEDIFGNSLDNSADSIISDGTGLLANSSSTLSAVPITQQTLSSTSVGQSIQTELASQFQPTLPDLLSNFANLPSCVSLYAQHLNSIDPENTIYSEPKFTHYGLYFKGTLDYIFLFCQNYNNQNNEDCDENIKSKVKVTKLLKMPQEEHLLPLLPNYKFNSDHLCLMVEV
ncbi:16628_t:CDS:2, partial [Racocetra fulgida]